MHSWANENAVAGYLRPVGC